MRFKADPEYGRPPEPLKKRLQIRVSEREIAAIDNVRDSWESRAAIIREAISREVDRRLADPPRFSSAYEAAEGS